ncbi:MAG: HAMP domain-containing sensor histidine kinase [Desulfobacterales bacterium]|nr:HAMP domain-containing sensor histidine kinase [Desulfobacterales bacterium]
MKSLGIHARLVIAAVMVLCITAFLLGFIGVKIFQDFAFDRFHGRMDFLARYLAMNSELGILIDEPDMLEDLAGNLIAEQDVAEVTISSSRSGILAKKAKQIKGPLHDIEKPVRLKTNPEYNRLFEISDTSEAEKNIGSVKIIYSTSGIKQILEDIQTLFFWVAAGLALICVILFYYISRSIVAPLKNLSDAAQRVSCGELHIRLRPGSVPETREVGVAFNSMLDSIEKNRQAIENAHMKMARQQILAEMGKFSMMVAHEVKNPLGIMKSTLDVLKRRIPSAENNDNLVGYIEEEITQLNKLIEDFLTFAQPAVPSFKEVEANQMLGELIERLETQHGLLEFDTHIPEEPCEIYADKGLCDRALFNILINAVSANKEKGIITIIAECLPDKWRAVIADQGPGIAEADMEKIFEPFYSTRSKGSGLGLTFATQVVKAHGGVVYADNYIKGGAVFTVEIPRNKSENPIL